MSYQIQSIPITKARINLGALVKRVHLGKECFILEKDGIPIAGLIDIDELEDYLELQNPEVSKYIKQSTKEYLAGKIRPAQALRSELKKVKK